ncbi:DUF998 domain-containing protein [Kribbella sandramycini]|uniref:DUF998 domain-containing protein n=1 Tax=Kribbella sandramycini TaxID=60450 RepID=A0A7Y4NWV4_9ACTN|nr:DUF998 domain-containing protein [Kribbella sandramycini]MBB6568633.1 uncharacterized membrane protein (UPF0136 family) [Kribbella sandramycini]NOL38781.1 DUF998 domain-containing protein [Kribbella sandramycini]
MTTLTATAPPATVPAHRLLAGVLAGPVFFASAGLQMLTRDGFDLTRHPISQLATGPQGWIQISTFVAAGLGVLTMATGLRTAFADGIGRRALPILVAIFGIGLIASGIFTMDAEHGFPTGTPDGPATDPSWHSVAHGIAAATGFTALAVAAIVLVVRSVRRRRVVPAVLSGLAAVVLLAPMSPEHMSLQIAFCGLVGFTWTSVVALVGYRASTQRRAS